MRHGDLEKHNRSHSRARPYPCEHCPKRFKNAGALTAHVRTHTGERPYKCAYCDKSFSQRSNCWRHQINIHGGSSHTIDKQNRAQAKRRYHHARATGRRDRKQSRAALAVHAASEAPRAASEAPRAASECDPIYEFAKALVEALSPKDASLQTLWWLR